MTTLRGARVVLRPLSPDDVEPLNAIIALPGVREWWGTDPTVDDQDAFTIEVDGEIAGWLGWYEETSRTTGTAGSTSSSRPRSMAAGWVVRRCGSRPGG